MPHDLPRPPDRTPRAIALRAAGTALVLGVPDTGLPYVLHWGADLPDVEGLAATAVPTVPHNRIDEPLPFSLLPGQGEGWAGHPGLSGDRDGRASHPRWRVEEVVVDPLPDTPVGGRLTFTAAAEAAGLALRGELRVEADGLVRIRHEVTNTGEGVWNPAALHVFLPLPREAGEVLDLTGRWCRERSPQRREFAQGTLMRAARRGRTGHDATLFLVAGTPGFGFRRGEVWGVHVAWSGDHVHLAERLPEGAGQADAALGGGELLHPGEARLGPGESHRTPWVCFSWSDEGLDGMSARVHRWLRARPHHPSSPRPVVLNTWEAVYFDHDLDALRRLADTAARIGVERFVLDDGWFRGRRDDTAGLGDWTVDPGVWPDGLHPLFDHVRSLGMQVGLWVEPEMVNPDSDLFRAHPEWVLAPSDHLPRASRHQQVLDLGRPEVAAHLLERLDALVTEYRPHHLKWDHNRDLLEAVHGPTGGAGVHRQTTAVHDLLRRLRDRHPGLEIESCSSGGGRVDLSVLEHTDRVWASDVNDPLERLSIQRWTGLLLPPELVGGHVGGPVSHTTGRVTDLTTRCLTALIGHPGIEWDITGCTEAELGALTRWIALYRELRPLLHSGDPVHADDPDPAEQLDGVVARDGTEAVYRYARPTSSVRTHPGRVRLPGLHPGRRYRLRWRQDVGRPTATQQSPPEWFVKGESIASGHVLTGVGVHLPNLDPGQMLLLHLTSA
ncbi:alpha-galactosidase [Nocardiopsis sp. N85]|uniref:alpha-galactosidase n=1 Tax=Nocardiopsis sp. N85 TaxID=3029400 RepID=UPI00237FCF1A|nr:alpha-galactosidase [Nocardiopsis sp. N85]MDE3722496.1 alpha-galactosidase [Nocardiopsis sp. N85]